MQGDNATETSEFTDSDRKDEKKIRVRKDRI